MRRLRAGLVSRHPGGRGHPSAPTTRGCLRWLDAVGLKGGGSRPDKRRLAASAPTRKYGPANTNRRGGAPGGAFLRSQGGRRRLASVSGGRAGRSGSLASSRVSRRSAPLAWCAGKESPATAGTYGRTPRPRKQQGRWRMSGCAGCLKIKSRGTRRRADAAIAKRQRRPNLQSVRSRRSQRTERRQWSFRQCLLW